MQKANEILKSVLGAVFLPLLFGAAFGMLASSGLEVLLPMLNDHTGQTNDAVITSGAGGTQTSERTLEDFIASNPFHVSPQKVASAPPPPPAPVQEAEPVLSSSVLDGVILRGTFPGIGAWVEQNGALKLLLIGKTIERYRLSSVRYNEATFRWGRSTVTKYITYGPVAEKPAQAPAPSPSAPAPASAPAPSGGGDITAASGSSEGTIPAELVNSLVQNPFDELKRIRMRPNEKGGGLEVQWIQNDSILKHLGVQRRDTITALNGIRLGNIRSLGAIIDSLLKGESFDIELIRGGKSIKLLNSIERTQ